MVRSRRSACSALSLRFCGVEPAMYDASHSTTPGASLPPLELPSYHPGRPIKGYWDMKTTRCMTTWLAARPKTGLIQPVDEDAT